MKRLMWLLALLVLAGCAGSGSGGGGGAKPGGPAHKETELCEMNWDESSVRAAAVSGAKVRLLCVSDEDALDFLQ